MAKRPDGPAVVTRLVHQRERADCAIAAISMFTGRTYEDVLREVVIADPKQHGRDGLHDRQLRKVLAALGVRVRYRSRVDYDEDYGLLRLFNHVVVLRNGLIFEDGQAWEVDDWRRYRGYQHDGTVCGIFVAAEP